MAALRLGHLTAGALAGALCLLPRVAHAGDADLARWRDLISQASRTFNIPESWIASVMRAENAGMDTLGGRPITSPAGAMGLMQIMPATWAALRSRYGLGSDPFDPHDNAFAGAAYLRELYQRYGYPNLFAAYNAGPGRLESYLDRGRVLPRETTSYLAGLGVEPAAAGSQRGRLFFSLTHGGLRQVAPEGGRLFMALRTAPRLP